MRFVFKLILLLLALSPFALAAALWFGLSEHALVAHTAKLSHQDIARAQSILKKNDPRRLPAGSERVISINERDLNLTANFVLQKLMQSGAQIRVHPGYVYALGTLRIPRLSIKPFLNIQLKLEDADGKPRISKLQIGQLPIPSLIANVGLGLALENVNRIQEIELASNILKKLEMRKKQLLITYRWDPAILHQARETLLSGGDKDAMSAYHAELIKQQQQGIKYGSLSSLLMPLFQVAEMRSKHHDPITENRSLLAVLGAWSSGQGLNRLVPNAAAKPAGFRLKLERRVDLAQHFLTSAALASAGNTKLSNAVGLFKEISDSQGGSGFSFSDLAADRAGSRFGQLATQSNSDARKVQRLLTSGLSETDIMPKVRDLPEPMNATDFKQRFGDVGSSAYERVISDIDRRISNCRLYQIRSHPAPND